MDFNKDYYSILGVLPTAELVVIKAAYKAMLKVYHPDKYDGSKSEAHAKTVEINEALSVLSDASRRHEYDKIRGNTDSKEHSYNDESKSEDDFSSEQDALEKDWQVAIKYQPELIDIVRALSKISSKLAFTYKAVMIESQEFYNKFKIADKMEQDFLSLYFGVNKEIQSFAKALIIDNHRDAARELNKAVMVLGKGIDTQVVIDKIREEYLTCSKSQTQNKNAEKINDSVIQEIVLFACIIIFIIINFY